MPRFEAMELGPGGRLVRDGLEHELNPYCRRAVSKGVELAHHTGGTATVITLGPPGAEDVLREAVAWGASNVILVSDPAFAGSDTLATARALAAALVREGPFALVLVGRNSVDADTGQVGPEVAQLLDLPFATRVRRLDVGDGELKVLCEEDDGESERVVKLPAIVSIAERLIDPAEVDSEGRAAADARHIRTLSAGDLGLGPWGQEGSGTYVDEVRVPETDRARLVLAGTPAEQVEQAVHRLVERGALAAGRGTDAAPLLPPIRDQVGPAVAVVVEPGRVNVTSELLGPAAALAEEMGGHVVALAPHAAAVVGHVLAACGADAVVQIEGAAVEEDIAATVSAWASSTEPWAILLPSTTWGREVGAESRHSLG